MTDKQRIAQWIKESRKIAVITGAGMSTESGIPDFRSSKGLYNQKTHLTVPLEDVLSRSFFESDPALFYSFFREHLRHPSAEPNEGHYFLKRLELSGIDITIITQNIDGLHQKAGSRNVIELHGNVNRVVTKSGKAYSYDQAVETENGLSVNDEWARPAVTLYGELLDSEAVFRSIKAVEEADILLVMGTSLNVYPAAGLVYDYTGSRSILVNKGQTGIRYPFAMTFKESITLFAGEVEAEMTE
ncbi:MAG: NAD-dependent protein deacylase [Alkalibacterium sp.]|nr:NAD-dependent protein deacylase [Alkalibacterium sp.]